MTSNYLKDLHICATAYWERGTKWASVLWTLQSGSRTRWGESEIERLGLGTQNESQSWSDERQIAGLFYFIFILTF